MNWQKGFILSFALQILFAPSPGYGKIQKYPVLSLSHSELPLFSSETSRRMSHKAIFETFFDQKFFIDSLRTIKTLHPENIQLIQRLEDILSEAEKKEEALFKKFDAMTEVNSLLTVMAAPHLLTQAHLINIFAVDGGHEASQIHRDFIELRKSGELPKLQNFLTQHKTGGGALPGIWNLSRKNRYQFIFMLTQSHSSFLRQVGSSLRNLYVSEIFKGRLGELISHIPAQPPMEADMLPSPPQFSTPLHFDKDKKILVGELDNIIIGSGVAGSVVSHELQKAGKKVLILEKGSFVLPGAIKTFNNFDFMDHKGLRSDNDASVFFLNGSVVGGGSTINIDMSFPPTRPYIRRNFELWRDTWKKSGKDFGDLWNPEEVAKAWEWVRGKFSPRTTTEEERNKNNQIMALGHKLHTGVDVRPYQLNRWRSDESPFSVTNKKGVVETLLYPAIEDEKNPLTLLSDAQVTKVLFNKNQTKAIGVEFMAKRPWKRRGIIVDPYNLQLPLNTKIRVYAKDVILSAGNLGSTILLKKSGVQNKNIGRGFVTHPFVPVVGKFDDIIDSWKGEPSSVFSDYYLTTPSSSLRPGFLLEPATGTPELAALMLPGTPMQLLKQLNNARKLAGFGVILVERNNLSNHIEVDEDGVAKIYHSFSGDDTKRFAFGVAEAIRMLLKAGAKEVSFLSFENVLGLKEMTPHYQTIKTLKEADLVEKNLKFVPGQTFLMGAHMSAGNKLGVDPQNSVVNPDYQVWGIKDFYVVDSSVFPTSVGANPMQSIYTIAKIFTERYLKKKAHSSNK